MALINHSHAHTRTTPTNTPRHTPRRLSASLTVHTTATTAPSNSQVTLTTQCSLDRWPRVAQQAESWGGPVSVAVYVPAPQHSAAADTCLQLLQQWAAQHTEQHPGQALHVSALFAGHYAREGASVLKGFFDSPQQQDSLQLPPEQHPSYQQLYAINALRNLAIQHASGTPLVLPVDGDFLFSEGLQEQLHSPAPGYSILQQQQHEDNHFQELSLVQQLLHCQQHQEPSTPPMTLVLPAFQLVPQHQEQQPQQQPKQQELSAASSVLLIPDSQRLEVPRNKQQLLKAMAEGRVQPFDCGVFAPKKQPLDTAAWATTHQPLDLPYVDLFEVHGGVSVRQQLPPYSEAFRGYGLNKQQHAWHAAALGFKFKALPDAFMVTAPHKRSTSWRPTPGTAADAAHLERISGVYAQFKQQLAENEGLVPPGL